MKKNPIPPADAAELRRRAEERLKGKKRSSRGARDEVHWTVEETQRLVQELQVHQIELEMQNEELKMSRAKVEAGLALYTELYDFAPMGYFTLDRAGTIRQLNFSGARLLDMERGLLSGRRFGLFACEADRPAFNAFLQEVFTDQTKKTCEVVLRKQEKAPPSSEPSGGRPFGETGRLMVSIEAVASENGQECRAVMTDITQRKQAEAALQEIHATLERNLKGTIEVISETIEWKGPNAPGHHRRVSALASAIAREMGLNDFQVQGIELAAAVYDIGLMTIPFEFLQDSERLNGIKRDLYQGYPQTGHDTLKRIEFPWPIANIILQHQERFDGSGFPQGLKGTDILIEARVLAVADAIADLVVYRSYRNALPMDEALAVISNSSGSLYDPDVVSACQRLVNEKRYKTEG